MTPIKLVGYFQGWLCIVCVSVAMNSASAQSQDSWAISWQSVSSAPVFFSSESAEWELSGSIGYWQSDKTIREDSEGSEWVVITGSLSVIPLNNSGSAVGDTVFSDRFEARNQD